MAGSSNIILKVECVCYKDGSVWLIQIDPIIWEKKNKMQKLRDGWLTPSDGNSSEEVHVHYVYEPGA